MRHKSFNRNHLKFLIPALVLVVLIDQFLLGGSRPYIEEARQEAYSVGVPAQAAYLQATREAEPLLTQSLNGEITPEAPAAAEKLAYGPGELFGPRREVKVIPETKVPQWQEHAVPFTGDPARPKVVIVIDDLGVSRGYSKEVIGLPGPLTLAFLPYPANLAPLVEEGRKNGHELIVHMPMEPMDGTLDMGSISLRADASPEEMNSMLAKGLGAFEGYVGINNHMGSRLTQDRDAMRLVMETLRRRGLLFLDSRTIGNSVGAETAALYNVPYAQRDVFLDDDTSLENVRERLLETERIAKQYGVAIAIGHPKPNTIEALREWLPLLEEKGLALAPVSAVVTARPSVVSAAQGPTPAQPHQ